MTLSYGSHEVSPDFHWILYCTPFFLARIPMIASTSTISASSSSPWFFLLCISFISALAIASRSSSEISFGSFSFFGSDFAFFGSGPGGGVDDSRLGSVRVGLVVIARVPCAPAPSFTFSLFFFSASFSAAAPERDLAPLSSFASAFAIISSIISWH